MTRVQGTSAAVETEFLSKPIVAEPGTACTESYLVAGLFDTEALPSTIPSTSSAISSPGRRFDFQDLLERRALDIAQPDVARAGGLTEIRRIAALTSAHGVRLAPHAWGSGVLFAASIHVAMAAPNCHIEVSQG
jgi:hypothetical protein